MNKNAIKNYAMWARNELITRVTQKAFEYGVSKDVIIDSNADSINGRLLTSEEKQQRQKLISEVKEKGFEQVMEEVAYTWFNRFIALRYMEVNNYLPNRVRVLTNEINEFKPQILDEAATIELDGLDKEKVYELLDSNKNEELYKLLLLAICNDMHNYLPGMFETINDYKVLLFPENLLRSESVLGKLISEIDEDSWLNQAQIIGWLYQYYIQNPKDEKINARKQYKDNDIPFVTQLFTSDWIVKFMVENSLGRYWQENNPTDIIKNNWDYYLDEKIINKSLEEIDPVSIRCIDPCAGSGHVLVYIFDVLMQIYESRGYSSREAVKSIVLNNIYGLDIDNRAAQLAYFSVMMKANQYDKRFIRRGIQPQVYTIYDSSKVDDFIINYFSGENEELRDNLMYVIEKMKDAKVLGSIIELDNIHYNKLYERVEELKQDETLFSNLVVETLYPLFKSSELLSRKYTIVVTNPPYMANKYMPNKLREYLNKNYSDYKSDLFSAFIVRCSKMCEFNGHMGFLTPFVWMFIQSYEKLRDFVYKNMTFSSLVQLEYNAFEAACVPVAAFSFRNNKSDFPFGCIKLSDFRGTENQAPKTREAIKNINCNYRYLANQKDFYLIPGHPVAYWAPSALIESFKGNSIDNYGEVITGMTIGDNNKYLRLWHEVSLDNIAFNYTNMEMIDLTKKYWIPYSKGGQRRNWYGNYDYLVNWSKNRYFNRPKTTMKHLYLKKALTWPFITSGKFSARVLPEGSLWDVAGSPCFFEDSKIEKYILGFMCSKVADYILKIINPTINVQAIDISHLPIKVDEEKMSECVKLVENNINISKIDWDSYETSLNFKKHPLIRNCNTIEEAYCLWKEECDERFNILKCNEENLNKMFIDLYELNNELDSYVNNDDVTVRKAETTREIKSLISFAVGCMFGRYSLDFDGLVYAGGKWNENGYRTFIPDTDNIIPICDDEYFEDDIVGKFIEFIKIAYGVENLDENLEFISKILGGKGTPREVLRNYFLNDFFKDHCNLYQVNGSGKRPIYWLFDSGKKNGFKALIYIHRYTPDLIARMRTQYIHEQQARYRNQIEMLERQFDSDISTSERIRLNKQLKKFKEQDEELRKYEEKIHHWADRMEPMDLDDGVKVNYAKFQEVLAKIK